MRKCGPLTLFVAMLLFFASGAVAHAAEFTVDSTADQPDAAVGSGGCRTSVETCTLRAAIEESNAVAPGAEDTIRFRWPESAGQPGATIELGAPLPTITRQVRLDGSASPFQCETEYHSIPGPCTGIDGPAGGTAFRISASGVDLTGFAITGAKTAVEVLGGPGALLWDNWFGIGLDGSAGPLETGVFVDQDSNHVQIGGILPLTRNVFAHVSGAGVNIDGADDTEVLGDDFGVMPDGVSRASNGTDIEIGDAATGEARTAESNRIGRRIETGELAGAICEGGCNVIAAAEHSGIDLGGDGEGEEPATGSTRILGNYIGLDEIGGALPNKEDGVDNGAAIGTTIGGPVPGDRNVIDGGLDGVLAGRGASELTVEGNWVGLDQTGASTLEPPTATGIAVEGGSYVEIFDNRLSMLGGAAIETAAYQSLVRGNAIGEGVTGARLPGGATGIFLPRTCSGCAVVWDNSVLDAGAYGVWLEAEEIHLYGNWIEGSGAAGVYVERSGIFGGVLGTLVGGATTAEENVISGSGGPAIEIVAGQEYGDSVANLVARNRGSQNAGPFISLVGGAEDGIQPPQFSNSTGTGASGEDAEPGDVIRVFRKAGASPGEIEGFLAETRADEAGDWSVVYPSPVPAGTVVAATQSREQGRLVEFGEGTSELAFATTTAPPAGGDHGGGVLGSPEQKRSPDPADRPQPVPQTLIVKAAPRRSTATLARFRFRSDQSSARFRCELGSGPVTNCTSPITYRRLRPGKHLFRVWAVSVAGVQDPSPARWTFWTQARISRRPRPGNVAARQ